MTKLYKLTDQRGQTQNNTQWGPGVSHSGTGIGELCGPGYIHAYTSAELALFLNPGHANFHEPRLWEAEGEIALNDCGLKVGCITLTTIRELPVTMPTKTQCITFGILCAMEVYNEPDWRTWAQNWLNGTDRSAASAEAVMGVTMWPAEAAAWAAMKAVRWPAEAAMIAAWVAEAAMMGAWAAEMIKRLKVGANAIDLDAIAKQAATFSEETKCKQSPSN
jgi:hypothetical protein